MTSEGIKVYTAKDVQGMFKCSKAQSYKIMNSRIFPTFRIGKRIYVTATDFDKFLSQVKNRNFYLR